MKSVGISQNAKRQNVTCWNELQNCFLLVNCISHMTRRFNWIAFVNWYFLKWLCEINSSLLVHAESDVTILNIQYNLPQHLAKWVYNHDSHRNRLLDCCQFARCDIAPLPLSQLQLEQSSGIWDKVNTNKYSIQLLYINLYARWG